MAAKVRLSKAVKAGWNECIRPLITCILENGDESQFKCVNRNQDVDNCKCDGCEATRLAWLFVQWADSKT